MTVILGIKLADKLDNAIEFQKILTKFNCIIKLRIGINETKVFCSANGIIILQIEDNKNSLELEKNLMEISGIELQKMIF